MLNLREIHKPSNIADAIKYLRQPDTVALAGGTQLIASKKKSVRAVVDLSALGLSYIRDTPALAGGARENGAIAIGATTTLADVVESPMLRAVANGVVAQAAHRTAASVLRNQGTVAGTLLSEPAGIFVTALVALDALIICVGNKTMEVPIADFLSMMDHFTMGAIVTEIVIPATSLNKRASLQTVARTPRDKPIVCACAAARIENSAAHDIRIALGGVAWSAVRANATERELENKRLGDSVIEQAVALVSQSLSPRADFRGSAEYRKEMAVVLTKRAIKEII